MQKTIKYVMVALVAIIAVAGCKKEVNWNARLNPNGNGCRLMSLNADIDLFGSYMIAFSYDDQGRVSKLSSGAETNNYVYAANKITATDETGRVAEIMLQGGRAVSSGAEGIVTAGGISYAYSRKYTYNVEGYLIQVKNYLNNELSTTDNLTYANGNLVSAVSIAAHGGYKATTTYSYSNEIAMNVYEISDPLSYHVDYFPGGYFGRQSKNVLIKSVSKTVDQDGNSFSNETMAYTYQYDAKGNATSLSYVNTSTIYPSGGTAETEINNGKFLLTYSCK